MFLDINGGLGVCRLRNLEQRACEGLLAGECNCGVSTHMLDLRVIRRGRGRETDGTVAVGI